jgi:hypothetical protein
MIRALRRALREWKQEFLTVWLRLTAFHRIVLGIVLGMLLVYGARSSVLDPLQQELDDIRNNLEAKGVPAHVPRPEDDDDVQQETLRAENLQRSIDERLAELVTAEAGTRFDLSATHSDAEATLLALANRHGLRVQENRAMEADKTGTVPASLSAYVLHGSFHALFAFLEAFPDEPLLWELRDIEIETGAAATATAGLQTPMLSFRFRLRLARYRGGDA